MPQRVLVIDNYDSFTYNLVQALAALDSEVIVVRNDAMEVADLDALAPDALVLSPGPGGPHGAGISAAALTRSRGLRPVLGVCLGCQVLAESFGVRVEPYTPPVHGKRREIRHDNAGIFAGLKNPLSVARYHSLAVRRADVAPPLRVVAWSPDKLAMALGVVGEATWGVQFHPESFMTEHGRELLVQFLGGVRCPANSPLEVKEA
ncbi:MAG: anthranilate synthase component II [Planctomycetota bacterium]